jgi:hypothetical protein
VSDRCPLCHRPSISDAAYWQGSEPVPPGACPRQGGPDCDDHAEDRTRLAWRVVEAARKWARDGVQWRVDIHGHARCNSCNAKGGDGHAKDCANEPVRAALRALDGEG